MWDVFLLNLQSALLMDGSTDREPAAQFVSFLSLSVIQWFIAVALVACAHCAQMWRDSANRQWTEVCEGKEGLCPFPSTAI